MCHDHLVQNMAMIGFTIRREPFPFIQKLFYFGDSFNRAVDFFKRSRITSDVFKRYIPRFKTNITLSSSITLAPFTVPADIRFRKQPSPLNGLNF